MVVVGRGEEHWHARVGRAEHVGGVCSGGRASGCSKRPRLRVRWDESDDEVLPVGMWLGPERRARKQGEFGLNRRGALLRLGLSGYRVRVAWGARAGLTLRVEGEGEV